MENESDIGELEHGSQKEEIKKRNKKIIAGVVALILIIAALGAGLFLLMSPGGPDSDGDGIPDNEDAFPNDPAASVDTDGDGLPDDWNPGYTADDSTTGLALDNDDDNDGIPDADDPFPDDPANGLGSGNYGYIGAIVPAGYIGTGTRAGSGYYFVGYQSNQTSDNMQTFEISSSTVFSDITGGEFNITLSNGAYVLDNVISSDSEGVSIDDMDTIINSLFKNIEVSFTSLSLVYGDYTFGIGTTGTDDYIWVAPQKSYPTFFNSVSVKGTVFDDKALQVLAQDYATSVFGNIDLGKITDLAQNFSFTFNGNSAKFVIVTDLIYDYPLSITGDVVDTITPADINSLIGGINETFQTGGTDWIEDVVSEIGQGVAIFTESDNRINNTKLWFLLYSLEDYTNFPGICELDVSKSDLTNLTSKIPTLDISSFDFDINFTFEVNIGIITAVTPATYVTTNVTGVWDIVEAPHTDTVVESVNVKGFATVVDLQTLIESIGLAFDDYIPEETINAIKTITTFKNPAFVMIVDEHFPDMLNGDGTPAWKFGAIAIIPDYEQTSSGLRYLNIKGVVYDPALYFNIDTELGHIPLIVADEYSEVIDGIQNVTVKDLRTSNVILNEYDWAYVDVDAITVGTTLKTLIEDIPADDPYLGTVLRLIKAFPFDLGFYEGMKIDGATEVYQVPIIYLATVKGPTYYELNITNIKGMYIDYGADLNYFEQALQENISSLPIPTVAAGTEFTPAGFNDLLTYLTSFFPGNISSPLTDFLNSLLNNNLETPGYILAFSMDEITNTPPQLQVINPVEAGIITPADFNITFDTSDDPGMTLWVEMNITKHDAPIVGDVTVNEIPIPVLQNGLWNSNELWWWNFIQEASVNFGWLGDFYLLSDGEYTVTFRAHDFYGYSSPVTVNFTISGPTIDVLPPTVDSTTPLNVATNVAVDQDVIITFSEPMNITTVTYTSVPDPGGWVPAWSGGDTVLTLTHNDFTDLVYTFTVTGGEDLAGNPLVPYPWTFTTDADIIPPTVDNTVPANLDINVAVDQNIVITFSEAMNTGTVTYSCVPDPTGWGESWSGGDTILTLTHTDFTNYSYIFTVTGGEDLVGNPLVSFPFVFTTVVDIIPPTVDSTLPTNLATGVAVDQDIVITFSEPMNTTTVGYTSIPDPGGWIPVWSGGDTILTLTHTDFTGFTVYSFTVTTGKDVAGNSLIPYPFGFTTIDIIPPFVSDTVPANLATGVAVDQNVVITFSEPMNTSTVTYTCVPDPGGWGEAWSGGDTILTLTHTDFGSFTAYSFTVTGGEDLATLPLVPYIFGFTTIDIIPPFVTDTVPANLATGVAIDQNVVITFSEPMNTGTVTYSCTPNPGGWGESWSGGDTILTLTHTDFAGFTAYTFTVTGGEDVAGNPLIPYPFVFTTLDIFPPFVTDTTPYNTETEVDKNQEIIITFNEPMNTGSITFTCLDILLTDPGGWSELWSGGDTILTLSHNTFASLGIYTFTLTGGEDLAGNPVVPYVFWFTIEFWI